MADAHRNLPVGDSLVMEGTDILGYNGYYPAGITAVSATTLIYITIGSSIGAIGAGESANSLNLQTYSGNLPRAMLNNPNRNTFYAIAVPFAANTSALPACAFKAQSATNVTYIKAPSTTVTTCATAPIITDGTASVTLTMTSGRAMWDSSVDTSTGVETTIFKPKRRISVTNMSGACATPPSADAVSYNFSPILST